LLEPAYPHLFTPGGQFRRKSPAGWLISVLPSIGYPKKLDTTAEFGEARRITFAVINATDNVRGEAFCAMYHCLELNRHKIARAIEATVPFDCSQSLARAPHLDTGRAC